VNRSILPLIRGARTDWRNEVLVENYFASHFIPALEDAGDRADEVKKVSVRSRCVRTERWKYIVYYEQDPPLEQLFDLLNDPLEVKDLAQDPGHVQTLAEMRNRYEQWVQRVVNR